MDAPEYAEDEDVFANGHPIFRTRENATSAGWHTWETNYLTRGGQQSTDWRATGLSCITEHTG